MDKRQKLMILLFACVICFIWGNSMLSPRASAAISGFVREALIKVFGGSDGNDGAIAVFSVRKIAHFVEFAVLGAELALYVAFFMKRRLFIALSYPAALLAALFDETVQMFSGRGSAIFDVWIDFFGFFIFASITYAAYFAVFYFYKWLKGTKFSDGKNN